MFSDIVYDMDVMVLKFKELCPVLVGSEDTL